jgi:hypothetical protein
MISACIRIARTAHAQDLDKKFQDTTQYTAMKKMLESKNVQLKELRAQLGQPE